MVAQVRAARTPISVARFVALPHVDGRVAPTRDDFATW
jgi:hypothetical protein